MDVQNKEGLLYLLTIEDNSIDLILTDPPYIISKASGMNAHYNAVKHNVGHDICYIKTEEEWNKYKELHNITNDVKKENYMKYGSIYGKKYCVKTDYGDWDSEFTIDILEEFVLNRLITL